MAYKILLDANVLIDMFSPSRSGYQDGNTLLNTITGKDGGTRAVTTPAIIHMTTYFLRKEYSRNWLRSMWKYMLEVVEVIELNHPFAVQAIHSNFADFEDALQYYAALQHRCTHFISSDKALKKAATTQLPVLTAKQFLQLLK